MVLEKLEKQENFTATEKIIADYLLDPSHDIEGLTSSKLAKLAYTSQTAVVRLYKKLGIDSYNTFYSLLLKELMERKNVRDIDTVNPIKNNMNANDVIDTVTKYYINEIFNTKLSIDKNKVQRLYNHIKNASSVQIYGNGNATFIMQELSNKISTFGIQCRTIETMNQFRIKYFTTGEKVAVFISLNNEIDILRQMALTLKKESIYIFGILNDDQNILSKLCNDVIYIGKDNCQNISQVSSALYIVDIIYSMFLSHYNN